MSNSNFHEINSCEVCGNDKLESVLDLGLHPMCDDLVSVDDNRVCIEYPIEILFCKKCNTAHQRFQVPKENLFPATYHYRSRFTADVLKGMKGLVDSCAQRFGSLAGKKVLDIGCNDGSLLDFFHAQEALTIGIEPTDAYLDAKVKGHITYNNFLSEKLTDSIVEAHGKLDFITFTNVFAHIEDLQEVLRSLKKLISDNTVIVIENHYLGSVLDGNQFDTFYHEHPRTYSYGSFVQMASTLGTKLAGVEFPSRYGGNIRVFLGSSLNADYTDTVNLTALALREGNFFNDFDTLRKNIKSWLGVKHQFLQEQFKKYGKLRAKAFPGRAAILIRLLGMDENLISAVYEKPGSLKVGHYLPGTRIPICSDDDLFALPDQTLPLLNLAWHIPKEIRHYLMEHKYTGKLVDILSAEDFATK
ncbi:class I SAM-dependent methyltransferase [Polynucleobacter necessarius]|uniref:class I SAM-dependent methyltransferase n=1 Tax=Polynucleobacter necessarius TaxID=576610 RepID=UPI000E097103|nr:class I SAM-dependent methyltransferase [Polynucleobacter necessarius]